MLTALEMGGGRQRHLHATLPHLWCSLLACLSRVRLPTGPHMQVHQGAILEQGTHEQLMGIPGGGYARLVAAQMRSQHSSH